MFKTKLRLKCGYGIYFFLFCAVISGLLNRCESFYHKNKILQNIFYKHIICYQYSLCILCLIIMKILLFLFPV